MYVAEYGPKDADTITLLHGGGGAGWMWTPQVDALKDAYHLLVPDLPEQGRSTDAGPFTMGGAAEQVASLIRSRVQGRSHVVGLSEGAQVIVQLLSAEPDLVETAIVSSALVLPMRGAGWASSPSMLRWSYRLTVAGMRGSDWWIRQNMRSAAGVPDSYFPQFRETFRTLSESGFVDLMVANQAFRLPEGLERVKSRVLAVCGAGEYAVMRRSTIEIAAAIPGAQAREVVHQGRLSVAQQHNWNMSAPEVFTRMVRAWIEGGSLPEELRPLGPAVG